MGEIKEEETLEEEPLLPSPLLASPLLSKRKPDVDSATKDSDPSKKLKKSDLEIPIAAPQENHNSTAEESQEDKGSNGNPRIDKGKAVMRDDKGKGKAKVEEEEGEEEDSSSGSGDDDSDDGLENNGGGDDSDVFDDPLAEVDMDNILPSRTRRRAAEPGAYLVNDMDDDDDDDDEDVDEDAEDEESE